MLSAINQHSEQRSDKNENSEENQRAEKEACNLYRHMASRRAEDCLSHNYHSTRQTRHQTHSIKHLNQEFE